MLENLARSFTNIFAGLRGRKITEANVADAVRDIQRALLEADVALVVVKDFVKRVKEKALGAEVLAGVDSGQQFVKIVNDELVELMGPATPEIAFNKKRPTVILLAGLQGSGKTTTCGKLARLLRDENKRRPLMVAADIQRPAAIEQLEVLGGQLDIPVFHRPGKSPPEICALAVGEASGMGCDTVLLDTAGRLHVDEALMAEIKQVAARTEPDEVFLVCDAMTGQDAVNSAREFDASLALTGVILTKLDGDARGGAALSVRAITGKPIRYVGVGEKLDRLEVFHASRMATRILGMGDIVGLVDKARRTLDQDEQRALQEKLLEAQFDLNDFLKQLQNLKKMGPLKDLLSHIPGFGGQMEQLDLEGNELEVIESIIQSMTVEERQRPEILNTSRRQRVARGSGHELMEVNDLLKQFKQMQGVLGALKGGKGMMGKFKAFRSLRRQMKEARGQDGAARGGGGTASASPQAPAGMAHPALLGMPSGAQGAQGKQNKNKKNLDALRKRRKKERQRRRRSRRR
ncbi:MAG: signal recognition particle protein [Planctomycetes bacterium]|nr:signal recognition particle protein [Planctomycetota bacterium]